MKKILFISILLFAFVVKGQQKLDLIIPKSISQTVSLRGNHENETWELVFAKDFPNIEVKIFDKWGKLIFHDKAGYLKKWNGMLDGAELPFDKYFYTIDLHDTNYSESINGTIRFKRK
jgi:gliding motility-associated-like protein